MHRSRTRRVLTSLLLAVGLLGTASCQYSQLEFRVDHRLTFVSPGNRAKVHTPLTISWKMTGFTPTGLDGSTNKTHGVFGVFVDLAPMPVGHNLKWLFRKDLSCKRDPQCPDSSYLSSNGVYITTHTSVTINELPEVSAGVGPEQHEVTVVLLDGTGTRLTESSWSRPFTSKRRSDT